MEIHGKRGDIYEFSKIYGTGSRCNNQSSR